MPRDRVIDSITGDYVSDGAGGFQTTRTAATALYTQMTMKRNAWWGNPDGGNDIDELLREGDIGDELFREAEDRIRLAMKPLLDAGRVRNLVIAAERDQDGRLVIASSVQDVQHGELVRAPSLRFGI